MAALAPMHCEVATRARATAVLNDAMREYWRWPSNTAIPRTQRFDAVLGPTGVTQYRGLLYAMEGRYPRASQADVDAALSRFGVRRMVVAHTLMPGVTSLYSGKVWAVDVADPDARREVLVFASGAPTVVNIGVARTRALQDVRLRPIARQDGALRVDSVRAIRHAARVPIPY